MKKIFTLFIALITFSSLFAQRGSSCNNYPSNNWNTQSDNRHYNDNRGYNNYPDHGVVFTNGNDWYGHDNGYRNDDERRAAMDRLNRDYDRRINDYRNNHRLNTYERERQIEVLQRERNDKLKAFGGGVLLGGILGVLLGSHM